MKSGGGMPNGYYDIDAIAVAVAKSRHRDVIGGMWAEIGTLQLDFLCSQGLDPSSRLIDIGCGCLRGGIHFIKFLQAGNYYGIDINQSLLDAGYDLELKHEHLENKLPSGRIRSKNQNYGNYPV